MFTLLTPTYNRAHTLERLYLSIKNQTFKEFNWLIIDDGSIDETRILVDNIKQDAEFEITYIYKQNGGKYTALLEAKKYLKTPYVIVIDSDDELLIDCLFTFNFHITEAHEIVEFKGRCIDSRGNLIQKFIFPENCKYIEATYHEMVFKMRNDEELLSCFKTEYFIEAVWVPEKLIFKNKFKCLSEGFFWSRIPNKILRYIKEPVRIYHQDSGNSIIKNTISQTGFYDDIVSFRYILDVNYKYFFWRPKYFISQYIKLSIACKLVGYGFLKSHFLYEKASNRLLSVLIFPFTLFFYLKWKYIDKKYWR